MTTRRYFVLTAIPAAALLVAQTPVAATEAVRLEETDPVAVALGYKHDASKVDAKKFAGYVVGRNCAGCQLYQGTAAWGACGAVAGKLVDAKGWCAAWVKKA